MVRKYCRAAEGANCDEIVKIHENAGVAVPGAEVLQRYTEVLQR